MNLIVNVPDDLFYCVFQFLDLELITLLDSAYCNTEFRNDILGLYSRSPVHVTLPSHNPRNKKVFKLNGKPFDYAILRKLKFEALKNAVDALQLDESLVNTIKESLVRSKVFGNQKLVEKSLEFIFASVCHNLVDVNINADEKIAKKLIPNNKKLKIIEFSNHGLSDFSPDLLNVIRFNCSDLTKLTIGMCSNNVTLNDFTSFYSHFEDQITFLLIKSREMSLEFAKFSFTYQIIRIDHPLDMTDCQMLINCFKSFKNITSYSLFGLYQLSDSALSVIGQNVQAREILIHDCVSYSKNKLHDILQICPNIDVHWPEEEAKEARAAAKAEALNQSNIDNRLSNITAKLDCFK
jgi:hypothetical protein